PGLKHAIDVAVVPGAAYVIDDFVAAVLDQRIANFGCGGVEAFVPSCALPLPFAARTNALQRKEYAFGVVNLVDGSRALGAVAAARTGMQGIAFELLNLAGVLIDISEETTGG